MLFSRSLFVTPWTSAYQAPPSMGFSRQEDWSGVPLPSPQLATLPQKSPLRKLPFRVMPNTIHMATRKLLTRYTVLTQQGPKKSKESLTTRVGFEPTRAEHNGLAVHHLNHSATSSIDNRVKKSCLHHCSSILEHCIKLPFFFLSLGLILTQFV